jgi:hypothetical protein
MEATVSATGDGKPNVSTGTPAEDGPAALLRRYRARQGAADRPVPWSWASLSLPEADALAALLDRFSDAYNRVWALGAAELVPPCWRRHPALAHDLAALAFSYHAAYRDPAATPAAALRFQGELSAFRARVQPWLGADPAGCRAGRHPARWRGEVDDARPALGAHPGAGAGEERVEEDAVTLLNAVDFGFGPGT